MSVPFWVKQYLHGLADVELESEGDSVRISVRHGNAVQFHVHPAQRFSFEEAQQIESAGERLLIATGRLSEPARAMLRERGHSWVERETEACWIVAPGLLVERGPRSRDLSNDRRAKQDSRAVRLQGLSGVYAETLLRRFQSRNVTARGSAKFAGVSAPLASRILRRLDGEGITAPHGSGPRKRRRLVDSAGLLDTWAREENREAWSRRGLYLWARTPREVYGKAERLKKTGASWAIAGTAAANLYVPTFTTLPPLELWIAADMPISDAADAIGGELTDEGANIFIWQDADDVALQNSTPRPLENSYWGQPVPLISKFRAYVEAVNAGGRSGEVAQRLRSDLNLKSTKQ